MRKEIDMGFSKWKDLPHKFSPLRHEQIKQEAREEFDRLSHGFIRKARRVTQVELAKKLGTTQGNVASLEGRSDLQLSTLSKYVEALGGELQVLAIFPETIFDIELPQQSPKKAQAARTSTKPRMKKRSKATKSATLAKAS